ncbi:flocculation protein FLO11-like [Astatotilapia calliptera]|uniref:flocculation protein FLO11-like n=1 Tax=Astatotilapia calliptera TaxID=8154 RepID=UPI000E4295DD|nr:flocculation protein FLO11-like [Astatotilapia calliptera]
MTEDYDHDMDPATHNPSAELREDLIYTVEYHCQEWEVLPGDEHREVVAVRLQRMVSGLPWLFGALHPHIRDFLVSTVGIRPELPLQCEESEDVQPGPLADSRSGSSPPPSRRKRRSRRRRSRAAEQFSSLGESDCASHSQPKFSGPGLHDFSTTVSNSVLPAIVFPESDNSTTVCLDSGDTIHNCFMCQPVVSFDMSSGAQSGPQPVFNHSVSRVSGNKMVASFAKLTERLGLSVKELLDQVKFCDPRQRMLDPVRYSSEPVAVKTVVGVTSSLDCVAPHPVQSESACRVGSPMDYMKIDFVSQPVFVLPASILKRTVSGVLPSLTCVRQHTVPQETVVDVVCFETASVTVPELTSSRTASANLESVIAVDFLGPACFKPRSPKTEFGVNNLVFPVSVAAPELCSQTPVPVTRAAQAQLSLAPVSVPRERVAEVQPVPASIPSLAEAPFIPAPVPAPRVGLMDTQPSPVPVPVPRVRSAVTLPTPAPVSVPRVGATEVQLAPAPTPAPRVKAARDQLVPAPVSVPRVGMTGVRPGLAPVPVPRRRATQSQTPNLPQAQLPLQLALLSITQSVAQLLAQFPVLSPVQSSAQLTAPQSAQSSAPLPPQSFASLPVSLSAQLLSLSPAQCLAQQPVQSLPTSAGSLSEPSSPAEDYAVLTHFKLTVCPTQPQPSHPKPAACPVPLHSSSPLAALPSPASTSSSPLGLQGNLSSRSSSPLGLQGNLSSRCSSPLGLQGNLSSRCSSPLGLQGNLSSLSSSPLEGHGQHA